MIASSRDAIGGTGTRKMTAQDYTSSSSLRQYRKLFKVGRGGMGDVHLALSTGHGAFRKLVVLKCRRPVPEDETDRRVMFLEEGRLAALLNHPNIVQTYEVGQLDGTDYIAMEFLEGQPVSHLSAQAGGLAPRLVAHIAEQVLRGLQYAQELRDLDGTPLNIIHRDLSPENIFITYDGAVKVLDFGIAKSDARSREVTEAGVLKGKLSYMAPEQVEAFTADRRTDIFVLGMVMWELITGKRLNSHRSAVDQFRWLTEGKVPSLMATMNVDPELDAIVQTACQRKPQSRYATAQEMRHALEGFLSRNGGGGAAEHLSRVMLSHFGRVRDSMRVQVRRQIQELEHSTGDTTVDDDSEESRDRQSAITYVVQNSDLLSDDDSYRNATTGRVVVPPKRSWIGWVVGSGLAASCLVWFQYARSMGYESIVFQMLPRDSVEARATPAATNESRVGAEPLVTAVVRDAQRVEPSPASAVLVGSLDVASSELEAPPVPVLGETRPNASNGTAHGRAGAPADSTVGTQVQIASSSASATATGPAPTERHAVKPRLPTTSHKTVVSAARSERASDATSKPGAWTKPADPQQRAITPQVDDVIPSRVPMVN